MSYTSDMMQDIERVLLTEEEIQARIREVGKTLTEEYRGKDPVVVGILKGAIPFYAAMTAQIATPIEEDFMVVSSYGSGTTTSGNVKIRKDLDTDVSGRHVLILEDILDSGVTLHTLTRMLKGRGALSVKICTLLDKPSGRRIEIDPDYTCFTIPGGFVVGFGLDYDEHYRNLPFIGILKPEVYAT